MRCEDCENKPRLIKVWAKHAAADAWKCPRCRRELTHDEYRRAQRRQVWQPDAARWVTTDEAAYILANMTPPLHKNAAPNSSSTPPASSATAIGREPL